MEQWMAQRIPQEKGGVIDLKAQSLLPLYRLFEEAELGRWGALWSIDSLSAELENPSFYGMGVVVAKKALVAALLWRDHGFSVEVTQVVTHPQWRGKGLMRQLFKKFLSHQGTKEVWLEVHSDNRCAQALYASLGFKQDSVRRAYYANGGDALCLRRPPMIRACEGH